MVSDFAWLTIEQVAPLLARRQLSPCELLASLFEHIEHHNAKINAFLTIDVHGARAAAVRAQAELLRGRCRGPLHGVPIALKDNMWTAGLRTTAGSKILANFVPVEDATVVRRLRRAGAVIVGKTNMSEFAYGATNNNQHYGATHNPWNLERTTGGSSGGSAAAVAAGFVFATLGTDTGGSIRIPAALCGVVGLKPTFGRVSCHGTMPLVPAYDHVGPMARSAADVAIMLKVIAGRDPRDSTTSGRSVPDYACLLRSRNDRLTLGRPREFYFDHLSADVAQGLESAARTFEAAGARIREVRLPALHQVAEHCAAFACAEATMVHRRMGYFPSRKKEYGEDVLQRLKAGAKVRAVEYAAAAEAQRVLRAEFDAALSQVDAILAPTVPRGATVIGQKTVTIGSQDESVRTAFIRLNRPANVIGLPSITVPCGFDSEGLPIGLQLIGRAFAEGQLLQIALLYAQSSHHRVVRPAAIGTSGQMERRSTGKPSRAVD